MEGLVERSVFGSILVKAAVDASIDGLARGSIRIVSVGHMINCTVGSIVIVGAGLGWKLMDGAGLVVGDGVVAVT
jgi:hypothetical protein